MTRYILILFLFIFNYAQSESYVKAGESLIWDSEKQSYTANGDVEFQNDKFIAFADEMIAEYIEQKDKEVFTIVELFNDVKIEFKDESFIKSEFFKARAFEIPKAQKLELLKIGVFESPGFREVSKNQISKKMNS